MKRITLLISSLAVAFVFSCLLVRIASLERREARKQELIATLKRENARVQQQIAAIREADARREAVEKVLRDRTN